MYVQNQWNISSWTKIRTTDDLHCLIKDQMVTKDRVKKNKTLSVRQAFGRAKSGKCFKYTIFGSTKQFLQDETPPASPLTCRVGVIMRSEQSCSATCITSLIQYLYKTESHKLHFGFL